jgi:hypothetical protein
LDIARIETITGAPDTIESIVCRRHQTANNPAACHRVHQGAALNLLILILIFQKEYTTIFSVLPFLDWVMDCAWQIYHFFSGSIFCGFLMPTFHLISV